MDVDLCERTNLALITMVERYIGALDDTDGDGIDDLSLPRCLSILGINCGNLIM
jgi:hypothetical protein